MAVGMGGMSTGLAVAVLLGVWAGPEISMGLAPLGMMASAGLGGIAILSRHSLQRAQAKNLALEREIG
ncbi:MAG: hypothetical protein K2X44_00540, partial [Magnetospirillum sp.]|nr:hypothetical protein [Magnetospirillum sp.]